MSKLGKQRRIKGMQATAVKTDCAVGASAAWSEGKISRVSLIVLALAAVLYVAFAWSPSHYQLGLRRLGVEAQPLLGTARAIRTDEWMVFTPMTQLAVRGGFSTHDQVSPYGQSLKGFLALPIVDWSLAFKPQLWCYWILPPAHAYSAYWAIMWSSMLAGYALLLWQCRVPLPLSILGAATLWMTHYVQVWWTLPAPAFALAPWPAVILASAIRPAIKWVLLPYVTAVWMFGIVYPPYQLPTVLALGALLLGLRRDIFTVRSVVLLAASGVFPLAIGLGYLHDVIATMRSTIYPGARVSEGGGVSVIQLVAHVLPYLSTRGFSPVLAQSNECEIAVVSSLLPLLVLTCVDYQALRRIMPGARWPIWIIGGMLVLMLSWIALPIPSGMGRLLMWHYVPPYRMTWAFGMLLTLSTVVLLSRVPVCFRPRRIAILGVAMATSWLAGQRVSIDTGQAVVSNSTDWLEFAAIAAVAGVWVLVQLPKRRFSFDDRTSLALAALAAGVVTFGTFNPIQPAHKFFDIPDSPRQQEFRQQVEANPNRWLITPGMYGAILNGAGIPAINHCLPAPQLAFFRAVFPDMDAGEFNEVFNRYANVMARAQPQARAFQSDAVVVPIDVFVQPQPGAVEIGNRQRKGDRTP